MSDNKDSSTFKYQQELSISGGKDVSDNSETSLKSLRVADAVIGTQKKLNKKSSNDGKSDLINFDSDYTNARLSTVDEAFDIKDSFPNSGYGVSANNYNYKLGDFDGDGKSDLIHFISNAYTRVWLSNGDGTFNIKDPFPNNGYGVDFNNYNYKVGDFNGDGKSDLIHFVSNDYTHVWISNGDGTFDIKAPFPNDGIYGVSSNNYNYQVGDFNGDDKSDLIHFVSDAYVHVWLSKGDGTFDIKDPFPNGGYGVAANNYNYKVGDFDGDGKSDLIHLVSNDVTHVWISKGDGTFDIKDPFPNGGYGVAANNYNYKVGDFDGDGKSDLIHFVSNDVTHVWLSIGNGKFDIKDPFPNGGYDVSANNYNYQVGDFNGNGKSDLIHFVSNDYIHVWISKINSTSETIEPTPAPTSFPTSIPTFTPTSKPTLFPTAEPTRPTFTPTSAPTAPTKTPTYAPSAPTNSPTITPSSKPTSLPTYSPSSKPTFLPTFTPTVFPTESPTEFPTMTPTAAVPATIVDLGKLISSQGFAIVGGVSNGLSGFSVSGAGDVNGDNYADIIIGAYVIASGTGTSYVVFGNENSFNTVYLSNLDKQGFSIYGSNAGDRSGWSVSGVGDVNGDGYDDVIIGAPYADYYLNYDSGISYLVFGKESDFANVIYLDNLDYTQGCSIIGANIGDRSGNSVRSAGDINGDGYGDIIIGAPYAFSESGTSYIIFGRGEFSSTIYLYNLDITQGFSIKGAATNDRSGWSVSGVGDINRDGYADVIVGAPRADYNEKSNCGISYVIFGKANFTNNIYLSSLTATQGVLIIGAKINDQSGISVSGAGDVNGDGYNDIIIGTPLSDPNGVTDAGISYVIFGKANFTNNIDLSSLMVTQGVSIIGANINDQSGTSVSSAGDVNGDGYDDMIIGAPFADPNKRSDSGTSYVIFGKESFVKDISLSSLTYAQGFYIIGANAGDNSGRSVSKAGDINGDGHNDIIIGAPNAASGTGISYVVYNAYSTALPTSIPTSSPTGSDSIPLIIINEADKEKWWKTLLPKIAYGIAASALDVGVVWMCYHPLEKWINEKDLLKFFAFKFCYYFAGIQHVVARLVSEHFNKLHHTVEQSETNNEQQKPQFEMVTNSGGVSDQNNLDVEHSETESDNVNLHINSAQSDKKSCVVMSIDALVDPKHVRLQDEEFTRFSCQLMGLQKDIDWLLSSKSDSKTLLLEAKTEDNQVVVIYQKPDFADNLQFTSSNNFVLSVLNTKQILYNLPIIHYLAQSAVNYFGYNVTLPDPSDNKAILISTDLVLGSLAAQYLPVESIMNGIFISTASTVSYAVRLIAADYLKNQEPAEHPIEFTMQCAATIAAYALPGIVNYALTKAILPDTKMSISTLDMLGSSGFGVVQCYNNYKAVYATEAQVTTTDIVVPYIADAITLWNLRAYVSFDASNTANLMISIKNAMSVAAIAYATHCVSSMVINAMPEVKEEHVDPALNFASSAINDIGTYIAEEVALIINYMGVIDLREDA